MERWSASLVYPLTACAAGAVAAFAFAAVDAPVWASFAVGLSTAVGALALRNWWIGEEERPLLAEELLGLHEAVDALRADALEMRDMLGEALEIADERIAEDVGAPGAEGGAMRIERPDPQIDAALADARRRNAAQEERIRALEARLKSLEVDAADAAASEPQHREPTSLAADGVSAATAPFAARFDERLQKQDARTRKLLEILEIAIRATSRHDAQLRKIMIEREQPDAGIGAGAESGALAQSATPVRATSSSEFEPHNEAPHKETPHKETPHENARIEEASSDEASTEEAQIAEARRNVETELTVDAAAQAAPTEAAAVIASAAAEKAEVILTVQPVFDAQKRDVRLIEVMPDADEDADLEAGALLDRALKLASELKREGGRLATSFKIGLGALRSNATLSPLLAQLKSDPTVASLLAPVIPHEDARALSDQDFALMRRLADAGVRFGLRDVDSSDFDPDKAAQAGVRFVFFKADNLAAREQVEAGATRRLSRRLAHCGLALVATDVADQTLLETAARDPGVLAQGAALAPARRVRFG